MEGKVMIFIECMHFYWNDFKETKKQTLNLLEINYYRYRCFIGESARSFLHPPLFYEKNHYQSPKGIGKIGLCGYIIGFLNGATFMFLLVCLLFQVKSSLYAGLITWNLYVFFLTLFHFMEFFVTSIWQPSTLSYDCKDNNT